MPAHGACSLMCHGSTRRLQGQPALSLLPNHSWVGAGPGLYLQVHFLSLRPPEASRGSPLTPTPFVPEAKRKIFQSAQKVRAAESAAPRHLAVPGGLAKRNQALTPGHVVPPPASTSPGPASL